MSDYNGWANYETWNVILWIANDESLYESFASKMRAFRSAGLHRSDVVYCVKASFADVFGSEETPDHVSLSNEVIDWKAVVEFVREMYCLDYPHDVSYYEEIENKEMYE